MSTRGITKMRAKTLSYIPIIKECIENSPSEYKGCEAASKKLGLSHSVVSAHWANYKKITEKSESPAKHTAVRKVKEKRSVVIQETLLHVKNGSIILKSGIEIKGDFLLQL